MNYERMFASAVVCLAEITQALKIPPGVASVATGSSEILAAIRKKDELLAKLEKALSDVNELALRRGPDDDDYREIVRAAQRR